MSFASRTEMKFAVNSLTVGMVPPLPPREAGGPQSPIPSAQGRTRQPAGRAIKNAMAIHRLGPARYPPDGASRLASGLARPPDPDRVRMSENFGHLNPFCREGHADSRTTAMCSSTAPVYYGFF